MKTLRDYFTETAAWAETPVPGDDFAIELAPDHLIESYVIETTDDGIVIYGDERVVSLLEEYGCTNEEIRRYGAVGSSPGMGYSVAEDEVEEHGGGIGPAQRWQDVKEFDRIMELAGVADHKVDLQDDVYSEDQDAAVLAQKKMAIDIDNPMPGVHEAEYHGREVPLGKPMAGDVKKSKVYVKDPKTGNVIKVNFGHGGTSAKRAGQKPMHIKKDNPARRKSFRARHNCENPGPRTKARYWSCRAW